MNRQDYVHLVTGLYKAVGIHTPPDPAVNHVSVAGSTVGLVYDDAAAPNTLFVYVDLGNPARPDLDHQLLSCNATLGSEADGLGHFARWEESGSVIYRVAMPVSTATQRSELAEAIARHQAVAHSQLQQLCS